LIFATALNVPKVIGSPAAFRGHSGACGEGW
jgi:hypothetical protein